MSNPYNKGSYPGGGYRTQANSKAVPWAETPGYQRPVRYADVPDSQERLWDRQAHGKSPNHAMTIDLVKRRDGSYADASALQRKLRAVKRAIGRYGKHVARGVRYGNAASRYLDLLDELYALYQQRDLQQGQNTARSYPGFRLVNRCAGYGLGPPRARGNFGSPWQCAAFQNFIRDINAAYTATEIAQGMSIGRAAPGVSQGTTGQIATYAPLGNVTTADRPASQLYWAMTYAAPLQARHHPYILRHLPQTRNGMKGYKPPGEPPKVISPEGHRWHLPGPRVKERKVALSTNSFAVGRAVNRLFNLVTESGDVIESFWEALPDAHVARERAMRHGKNPTMTEQLRQLYRHWNEVDMREALGNLLVNHLEDKVIGKFGKATQDAYRKTPGARRIGITTGPAL